MTDSEKILAVRDTWETAASGWAKWENVLSSGLDPVTNTMLDMADVGPGWTWPVERVTRHCLPLAVWVPTVKSSRLISPRPCWRMSDATPTRLD
jgi:hypothetical protein